MKHSSLLLLVFLTACQVSNKPDLARLYQPQGNDHSNTPLVLIHGSLGSKLQLSENKEQVWPGKINDLIFSDYKILANVIDAESLSVDLSVIEPYAIFDSFSGISIYDEIIETLSTYGGYHLSEVTQAPKNGRNMYVFIYDWRQDNVYNAQQLASFIDAVLKLNPSHENLDVVAHSMGGLILRYYQRFGSKDVLADLMTPNQSISTETQANKIRHAIFLGTPQLGSVKPIDRLKAGFDFNLRNIPVEVQISMPSIYQLLPYPNSSWLVDLNRQDVNFNLYDPESWKKQKWSIYNPEIQKRIIKAADSEENGKKEVEKLKQFFQLQLNRAEAFWQSLSPQYEVAHEGFVILGGSCNQTLNKLIAEEKDGQLIFHHEIRRHLGQVQEQKNILFEPGDGQVSKSSLLGLIQNTQTGQTEQIIKVKYPIFVCEDHFKLTQNLTFQDNLLHVLLNSSY